MKVDREDVVAGAIGVSLAMMLLGIPQAVWARLRGKPASGPSLYIPSSTKRAANPGPALDSADEKDTVSTKRKGSQAPARNVEQLLRQFENNEFPAQLTLRWRGKVLARLVREVDYEEMAELMAAHLKQLSDRAKEQAEAIEEYSARLEQNRQEREAQRKYSS